MRRNRRRRREEEEENRIAAASQSMPGGCVRSSMVVLETHSCRWRSVASSLRHYAHPHGPHHSPSPQVQTLPLYPLPSAHGPCTRGWHVTRPVALVTRPCRPCTLPTALYLHFHFHLHFR